MPSSEQYFNFNHLSIKDLVEARDMFHVHFMNKKNVVATAIGRYLIRQSDLDENGISKEPPISPQQKSARTLTNSLVTALSWPCILVFVETWEEETDLLKNGASNIVPKMIYMPDGRVVPVCVVVASKEHISKTDINIDKLSFPVNYVGGGFPLIIHSQGVDHIATLGCIVSDGHKFYALTNKHVVGSEGETIETKMGDDRIEIGTSSGNTLGKVKFSQLYPGWQNNNMLVSCDAGLIEINDITRWKTDVVGIKAIDALYDLNTMNLTLGLIAEHTIKNNEIQDSPNGKVVGYGAVSRLTQGEILGLFYRYKSVGGVEYVSDFLIAGRNGKTLSINHGDSGALWLLETLDGDNQTIFQPIALHWGQHSFFTGFDKLKFSYSLSTSLSNICRELDVELVRGWNMDMDYSWGKVGHYTVGNKAIDAIENADLKKLMMANITNISFRDGDVNKSLTEKGNPQLQSDPDKGFCPLADVPDIIWKQSKKSADGTRGTDWGRRGDENTNHYADADAPTITGGKTLYDLCNTQARMKVKLWQDYYKNIDKKKTGLPLDKDVSQGLVCFRVWQIFDYMVEAVTKKQKDKFIFAAGVLAHYVGDACQPLHSSYMSDGNPIDNQLVDYVAKRTSFNKDGSVSHNKGDVYKKIINPGSGVHVAYEDQMIDDNIDNILPELRKRLEIKASRINKEKIMKINSGQGAAFATLTLMKLTQQDIHPIEIVETFKATKGSHEVSKVLYDQFGDKTIDCLARGCRYLAAIWDAAWAAGNKNGVKITSHTKVKKADLIALYRTPTELPSMHLDTINPLLKK